MVRSPSARRGLLAFARRQTTVPGRRLHCAGKGTNLASREEKQGRKMSVKDRQALARIP